MKVCTRSIWNCFSENVFFFALSLAVYACIRFQKNSISTNRITTHRKLRFKAYLMRFSWNVPWFRYGGDSLLHSAFYISIKWCKPLLSLRQTGECSRSSHKKAIKNKRDRIISDTISINSSIHFNLFFVLDALILNYTYVTFTTNTV